MSTTEDVLFRHRKGNDVCLTTSFIDDLVRIERTHDINSLDAIVHAAATTDYPLSEIEWLALGRMIEVFGDDILEFKSLLLQRSNYKHDSNWLSLKVGQIAASVDNKDADNSGLRNNLTLAFVASSKHPDPNVRQLAEWAALRLRDQYARGFSLG